MVCDIRHGRGVVPCWASALGTAHRDGAGRCHPARRRLGRSPDGASRGCSMQRARRCPLHAASSVQSMASPRAVGSACVEHERRRTIDHGGGLPPRPAMRWQAVQEHGVRGARPAAINAGVTGKPVEGLPASRCAAPSAMITHRQPDVGVDPVGARGRLERVVGDEHFVAVLWAELLRVCGRSRRWVPSHWRGHSLQMSTPRARRPPSGLWATLLPSPM